jgi:hypothetical protein
MKYSTINSSSVKLNETINSRNNVVSVEEALGLNGGA